MERLEVYLFHHNFMKSFRINGPEDTGRIYGEAAGIPRESILSERKTLFTKRRFLGKLGFLNVSDRML